VRVGLGPRVAIRGVPRDTLAGSAALGVAVTLVAAAAGHAPAGLGIALGLVIGSANGYLIAALLDRNSSFLLASLMRLAALTALAVGGALLLQSSAWTVLLGVGAAQLVMVAAGVRRGLRS
jgi:urea transporter